MVAHVLLLRRLPRRIGVFDYAVPKELETALTRGSLVLVPFRSGTAAGVVAAVIRRGKIHSPKLKPVARLLFPDPLATPLQMALLAWAASYFHASPATVAKTFIPRPVRSRTNARRAPRTSFRVEAAPPLQAERLGELLAATLRERRKTLLFYHTERTVFWCYRRLAQEAVRLRRRVLFLFPRIAHCDALFALLPGAVQRQTAVLTGALPRGTFFREYTKALQGALITIGTQPAAIPPLPSLQLAVLHDEDDPLHFRSDQNPRLHLRKVLVHLSARAGASLILASRTPSLTTYLAHRFGQYRSLHVLPPRHRSAPLVVINMRDERRAGNHSVFAEALQKRLDEARAHRKQALLLVFRRGIAAITACLDCGFRFTCPICDAPLRHESARLLCPQGHVAEAVPLHCPSCRGTRLRAEGAGSQRIEQELQALYPKARIVRSDASADVSDDALRDADCIVATAVPLGAAQLPRLSFSAVVLLDPLLARPDLSADEEAFRTLVALREVTGEAGGTAVLCQTYSPSHPVLRAVATGAFAPWYQAALAERKYFAYPPFAHLLRLSVQRPAAPAARAEAERVFRLITAKAPPALTVLPPSLSRTASSRHWVRSHIILKTKLAPSHQILDRLVGLLPNDWVVEVDPESIA